MTDRLIKPQRVASRLDCGITQAKFKMRNDLGGWYEPGIGWRCTERALNAFIASRAKGAPAWTEDQSRARAETNPSSRDQPSGAGTGIATSERLTADDRSVGSISAPTILKPVGTPPSLPSGRSKPGQQLDKLIARSRKQHSRKPSTRSSESSKPPE